MTTRRGYVGEPGQQVHYRAGGSRGPVVVLLHESPQASNVFEPALAALGRSMRAFALDTPGYGLSDPPEGPCEIPRYSGLLLQAIDDLGIDTFSVVGQHTGASLAVELARQAGPRRVQHVVLSGIALLTAEERAEFLEGWAPDIPFAEDGSHLRNLWERYIRLWEGPPDLLTLSVTNIASILPRYNWAYNAAFRYDPGPALAQLEAHILLLTAGRDMLAHLDDRARSLRPDALHLTLTQTTGQLPWREPDRFAEIVEDFVSGRLATQ
jgi:pimeloyl-ACP methyl ester carboxylesterase